MNIHELNLPVGDEIRVRAVSKTPESSISKSFVSAEDIRRREVLQGLRGFVRAHERQIRYLQSGPEDCTDFIIDEARNIEKLVNGLHSADISYETIIEEVTGVFVSSTNVRMEKKYAKDLANGFANFLQDIADSIPSSSR